MHVIANVDIHKTGLSNWSVYVCVCVVHVHEVECLVGMHAAAKLRCS